MNLYVNYDNQQMSSTLQLIDVYSFFFKLERMVFFFYFQQRARHQYCELSRTSFPAATLGNLKMSVSNTLADLNSVLLEVNDFSNQSFLFHIATSSNLITLKKLQLLEYSQQIFQLQLKKCRVSIYLQVGPISY